MRAAVHPDVQRFLDRVRGFGFRAYLAERGTYGFITDAGGTRVLDFSFNDGGSLDGCYGPHSQESGTGWRMDEGPWDLRTAEDVSKALYAPAPRWCGSGWRRYTTLADQLAAYQRSSRYYGADGQPPEVGR